MKDLSRRVRNIAPSLTVEIDTLAKKLKADGRISDRSAQENLTSIHRKKSGKRERPQSTKARRATPRRKASSKSAKRSPKSSSIRTVSATLLIRSS